MHRKGGVEGTKSLYNPGFMGLSLQLGLYAVINLDRILVVLTFT